MRKHNAITLSQQEWIAQVDVSGARVHAIPPRGRGCCSLTVGLQRVLANEEWDGKIEYGLEDIRNILTGPPLAPCGAPVRPLSVWSPDPPVPRMPL